MKKSVVLATAVAAVLSSGAATADLTANAGVFSNYIWRGVSQTDDKAAGQGGIDYSHESGLYAGVWTSTIDGGQEVDLYGGFASAFKSLNYDLGVITYQYPKTPGINFTEVSAKGSYAFDKITLGGGVAYTVDAGSDNKKGPFDSGDIYYSGSIDYPVGGVDISVYGGHYSFDNDSKSRDLDYSHYGTSISKDGFSLALDKNDLNEKSGVGLGSSKDNLRVTVSYSLDFDL